MRFAALPGKCESYGITLSRSAFNWRAQVVVNRGIFTRNFYARSEGRAAQKAEDWLEANWPGCTGRPT